jgi:ribonuclease Y
MKIMTLYLILGTFACFAGILIGFYARTKGLSRKIKEIEDQSQRILKNAEKEAENMRKEVALEAKDKLYQARQELEKETREQRTEFGSLERRLQQREENLEKRIHVLDRKETDLDRREKECAVREQTAAQKEEKYDRGLKEQQERLESISGMSADEAKRQLLTAMEQEAKFEAAKMIKRIEDDAKENADKVSKEIIVNAVQRMARDCVAEATVSVLSLPNEEMKGRIIGREGRNIRALESLTGIDLIVDDTPEAVIISGFDPLRREIARISLERLMADGRIHPARIEEMVDKVKRELDKLMREEAEKTLFELGIHNLHPEMVKLLGRLKYRTSYGQNNLSHVKESAFICAMMAAELKVDTEMAKRGTLLHDIGKAVSHEEEGGHAAIGAELARKYGESPKVVNAIAAHHGDVEPICVESVLVAAAESLSAARPGARRESFDAYIKRLEKLEKLAHGFRGVEKAYAIQAGREIRIIVKHEDISDAESAQISRDIAKKIEKELTYPGQIKVTVIRESRYVEIAR